MDLEQIGKLFIGGLSWRTTYPSMITYFRRFGKIRDCVVMTKENGKPRGFGFVAFEDPLCVQYVMQSRPHKLDGRIIDPKPCKPRPLQKIEKPRGFKVFIGGLPSNTTYTDLSTFFADYGNVVDVRIMFNQRLNQSRGFGFITFEEELSVEKLTTERFICLNGKQIEVKKAERRMKRTNKLKCIDKVEAVEIEMSTCEDSDTLSDQESTLHDDYYDYFAGYDGTHNNYQNIFAKKFVIKAADDDDDDDDDDEDTSETIKADSSVE